MAGTISINLSVQEQHRHHYRLEIQFVIAAGHNYDGWESFSCINHEF